ncbi:alkaline shock response membrane anchor protein AmaP [Arthrobacter sp. AQ5-05]|uniref:alkaline shock response membrane anchor protein AmaP n=1 Tax=Arthrobacter sp. AQ5-05 TaxID=2184581 RepID=UPI0015EC511C|nr:alkaline shock response membrane anchor protein AmaP [Arthrobacter sp. AQ5-05]
MKRSVGTLNRTWLGILGFLVLMTGSIVILQAGGMLQGIMNTPPAGARVATADLHAVFAQSWVQAALLTIGVIVGVLGLLWMIAQIPRPNKVAAYRFHTEESGGRTLCDPAVLARAVEEHINTIPGVVSSAAKLYGTARSPEVSLKATLNDRADIQAVLLGIQSTVLPTLGAALEAPVTSSRIQIDISGKDQFGGTLHPSTGTVLQ